MVLYSAKAGKAIAIIDIATRAIARIRVKMLFFIIEFSFHFGRTKYIEVLPFVFFDFGILKYGVITDESTFFILCCCVL